MKYLIKINRDSCIACGACYFRDSTDFEADDEKKSKVVGETGNGKSAGTFDYDKFEDARTADGACPVDVISVTQL